MTDILSVYPDAKKGELYSTDCVKNLEEDHGFDLNRTILATSVCSDEVIQTATDFRRYLPLDVPFNMGGLAGYPFAGVTGLTAFAGHIPDDGGAIIIYGPHIGFTGEGETGAIKRVGQQHETTCCGALVAAVNHIRAGSSEAPDAEYDYQQRTVTELLNAAENGAKYTSDSETIVEATNAMYNAIHTRINKLFEKTADKFKGKKVALVGGIVINTDAGQSDWFEERNITVKSF